MNLGSNDDTQYPCQRLSSSRPLVILVKIVVGAVS